MTPAGRRLDLSLYVVTDPDLSRGRGHEEVAAQALAGGATVIQLRDKGASTKELCQLGRRLQAIVAGAGGLFIVNDRVDVALAVDADGVHLGQDDMPAHMARKLLGPDKVLGVSVENAEQAERAAQDGADYIGIGAIYEARNTKSDAGDPIGPQAVADLRPGTDLPIVAIGGIKHRNVAEVIEAGADGAAIVSAIVGAEDIAAAAAEMKRLIQGAGG